MNSLNAPGIFAMARNLRFVNHNSLYFDVNSNHPRNAFLAQVHPTHTVKITLETSDHDTVGMLEPFLQ